MAKKFSLLIAVLISSLLVTQTLASMNCREDFCIFCNANVNYTHQCNLCRYRRTTITGDCYGDIPIENCESYTNKDSLCQVCKEGYYLSYDKKRCTKIDINNCRWAFLDNNTTIKCSSCDKGYPDVNSTRCEDVKLPKRCKYGGRAANGDRICTHCKKGYSLYANGTECYDACSHGCQYCDIDNICRSCDQFNGYYEIYRSRDYNYPICEHLSTIFKASIWILAIYTILAWK